MSAFGLELGGFHAFGLEGVIVAVTPPEPPIIPPPVPTPGRRPPAEPVPAVVARGILVEIPVIGSTAQRFTVTLLGLDYVFVIKWNTVSKNWVLDIYNGTGDLPILRGVPLVTGANLLEQYQYLEIGGALVVLTIAVGHSPEEVPGFNDFGTNGHLYFEAYPG